PTAPTGNVSFSSGGTCTLGTQTANSASCSVNVIPTVAGTLTVSASYGGDPSHNSSTGSTSVTVSPGAPYALVVTSDGKVFRFYQNRTLTQVGQDRKSTRLNSSHVAISYAVFCLKKKIKTLDTH